MVKRNISIFWGKPPDIRLSSKIRGEEISQFLEVRLNPEKDYKRDICIHIKPVNLDNVRDGDWIDVLDGGKFIKKAQKRPKVNLIAASENSYEYLKNYKNKVVYIPHHHLNWERDKRKRNGKLTCGYIGSVSSMSYEIYMEIEQEINKIGFDFIKSFNFKFREDAVNFYRNIDLLVIGAWQLGDNHIHKLPTKIINAASFGIPTVAYPLRGYKEIEGYYVHANNMDELLTEVKKFQDQDYYNQWPDKLIKMSEKYHIENIVKLYKKLE